MNAFDVHGCAGMIAHEKARQSQIEFSAFIEICQFSLSFSDLQKSLL
jgi:hypothetical protein